MSGGNAIDIERAMAYVTEADANLGMTIMQIDLLNGRIYNLASVIKTKSNSSCNRAYGSAIESFKGVQLNILNNVCRLNNILFESLTTMYQALTGHRYTNKLEGKSINWRDQVIPSYDEIGIVDFAQANDKILEIRRNLNGERSIAYYLNEVHKCYSKLWYLANGSANHVVADAAHTLAEALRNQEDIINKAATDFLNELQDYISRSQEILNKQGQEFENLLANFKQGFDFNISKIEENGN